MYRPKSVSDVTVSIGSSSGAETIIFSQPTGTQPTTAYYFSNANVITAYSYVAAETMNTSAVRILLNPNGNSSGNMIVELRADNSGQPGTILATQSIAVSTLTPLVFNTVDFSMSVAQTSGTTYWVALNSSSYGAAGNSSNVTCYRGNNESTDVVFRQSTNGGSTWSSPNQSFDLRFSIIG